MAYTPTTWANGDTITAEKLNKLEQGVANVSILVVELTLSTGTADHTFAEIFEALRAGTLVYLHYPPTAGGNWQ
jgi:ribonuclease BN (tRNA processing enzyme)